MGSGDRVIVSNSHANKSIRGRHGVVQSVHEKKQLQGDENITVEVCQVRLQGESNERKIDRKDLLEEEEDELSRGDRIVVRSSYKEDEAIRGKTGKIKSIGTDGSCVVRLETESSNRKIAADFLRRVHERGPFETLAFDGLDELDRVEITQEARTGLYRYITFIAIPLGCVLFVLPAGLWYGMFELYHADFEVDEVSFLGEQAESLFFPSKGCIKDSLLVVYAWLLMIVWMPAAIIGAVVWPLWLVSLQLGVVLVADDVEDLMKTLNPAGKVIPDADEQKKAEENSHGEDGEDRGRVALGKFTSEDSMLDSTPSLYDVDGGDGESDEDQMSQPKEASAATPRTARRQEKKKEKKEKKAATQKANQKQREEQRERKRREQLKEDSWELDVALPGAMLVSTMEELSAWGPSMGFAFVGCICTALTLVPTAVAMESATMFAILVVIFFIPIQIAYAPANVSRLPSEPSSGALASSAFLSRRII